MRLARVGGATALEFRDEGTASGGGHRGRPTTRPALTPDVGHGPLDGAWWPYCDALELELPALVGTLEPDPGAVVRVTVDPAEWSDAPYTVMAPGRVIAVEPAGPGSEAHVITLDCGTVGRWVLLVVPPEEPAGTACRLLAAAADRRRCGCGGAGRCEAPKQELSSSEASYGQPRTSSGLAVRVGLCETALPET
ncbi:DUF5994 family protein [Streptomyces sp. NPDC017179]|uniref:DUF5994 family protein n=1 Tax=Streptomyces sp. NPDC017179 TaxID=3364979 RepID=UPI0037B944A2